MSPTQRALATLKKAKCVAAIVEKWNQYARCRIDMFGFADIVYLSPLGITALQVTSGSNHAHHRHKILAESRALAWLKAGGLIELWTYSKRGPRGKRKTWTLRVDEITEADFVREVDSQELPGTQEEDD